MTMREVERKQKIVNLKAKLAGLESDRKLKVSELEGEQEECDYSMTDIESICSAIEVEATRECRHDGDVVDLESECDELKTARYEYEGACESVRMVEDEVEKIEEQIEEVKKQLKKFKTKKVKK